MKKCIYMAVAAIAALSSCSSDDNPMMNETGKQALTFIATMEGNATRATYDETNKCASWDLYDAICIDGHKYIATETGPTTTFTSEDPAVESTHHAYFPGVLYGNGTPTFPAIYTCREGKFDMPMYAESTTNTLAFKNLCGVLAIHVKPDVLGGTPYLHKVELLSDQRMNGEFTIDSEGALRFYTPASTYDDRKVTYCYYPASIYFEEAPKIIYVPIPAGTYNPLTIRINGDRTMMTKKAGGVTIERNKIYNIWFGDNSPEESKGSMNAAISGKDVPVQWVRLWDGGPKFAVYNVGIVSNQFPETFGGHYCWGKTIDKDRQGAYNNGTVTLNGNDDTATALWGENWRMPTKAEFDALLANCDAYWTTNYWTQEESNEKEGMVFTGRGEYKTNSIFLPAANFYDPSVASSINRGYYWTSTPYESNNSNAHCLSFDANAFSMSYGSRSIGRSVRAVVKE